ncbi:pyruvate oxidase, partial [Enterococcus lactis]
NSFQELNEHPNFADVSVYNRKVMTPQSLQHVVDEAIKDAYEHKGVAIVTIHVDLGFEEIDEKPFSNDHTHKTRVILQEEKDLMTDLPYLE